MKKKFLINVWDCMEETAHNETAYDLKKIKIINVDKFTGDIILAVEFIKDK